MNIKLKVKDPLCTPRPATDGSLGYDIAAYDISYIEAINSDVVKVANQLGKTRVPVIDSETKTQSFIEKEQVFQLDTLYRCLIDTGIEVDNIPEGYEIQVRSKKNLALKKGILAVAAGGITNVGGKKTISVILYNLGNFKFHIKRFDAIAQIVVQKVEQPNFIANE